MKWLRALRVATADDHNRAENEPDNENDHVHSRYYDRTAMRTPSRRGADLSSAVSTFDNRHGVCSTLNVSYGDRFLHDVVSQTSPDSGALLRRFDWLQETRRHSAGDKYRGWHSHL